MRVDNRTMSEGPVNALQCETDFLSGVGEKLDAAKGKYLKGSKWELDTARRRRYR